VKCTRAQIHRPPATVPMLTPKSSWVAYLFAPFAKWWVAP
jgi:hypothetical protein